MPVGSIGKYERLDLLGHGTSGIVYLAWDTLLRRNVALKEIRAAGPEMERLIEEARLLERLRGHPNIVEVHSVDCVDGVILLDMELVRGQTLADLLTKRSGQPLPPVEAIRIVGAVLDALDHAHTRRIVHRDVKPANILVGNDGTVKLTDFGLAEALGTGSVAGGGGTYPYMAPEDFAEEADSDYRSDLWAVGVILYEMLTGKRPFNIARKKDPFAWKRAIDSEHPERPGKVVPGIPVALDDVVMKALSKSKTARFPTAQGFAQSLRAVVLPQVVKATQPAPEISRSLDGSPYLAFNNGTVNVYTLDQLRDAAAKYWEEGKNALQSGQMEAFLRQVGEVYIAELAMELSKRAGQSMDTRLFEFIERSAPDDSDEKTVGVKASALPVFQQIGNATRNNRFRIARKEAGKKEGSLPQAESVPDALQSMVKGFRIPLPAMPSLTLPSPVGVVADKPQPESPPAPSPKKTQGPAARGSMLWFVALLVLCLSPPLGAYVANTHLSTAGNGRFNNIQEALSLTGLLSAMLLIAGIGARVNPIACAFCFLPMSAGIFCLGHMGAEEYRTSGLTFSEVPLKAAALLVAPLILLISEAVTVKQGWKFWAGIVCLLAGVATAYYVHPLFK